MIQRSPEGTSYRKCRPLSKQGALWFPRTWSAVCGVPRQVWWMAWRTALGPGGIAHRNQNVFCYAVLCSACARAFAVAVAVAVSGCSGR